MNMNYKTSGIYRILNTENGKQYIGSATCVKRRWSYHRSALNRGIHCNCKLQRSWNKYGGEVFRFELLWHVDPELLLMEEQQALNLIRCEYNISVVAGSPNAGRKLKPLSEAHKAKLSEIHKNIPHREWVGRKHSAGTKGKMRLSQLKNMVPVEAIDKNTGEVFEFNSIKEAGRAGVGRPPDITACLRGRLKSHNGYYWARSAN